MTPERWEHLTRPDGLTAELDELAARTRLLYEQADEELRRRFDRSLSYQDGLFDRGERARRLGFAEGASIYNSALVYGEVTVGARTWIGPNVILDGSGGGLTIGAFCQISAAVLIFTHETAHWALSGGLLPRRTEPVSIGDRCYIGSSSVVAPGVRIGEQAVVGAGSFVHRAVPARAIVAGVPARRIGSVVGEGEAIELRYDSEA